MLHVPIRPPIKKRQKPNDSCSSCQYEVKFGEVVIFLVERKMGASRRSFLTSLARKKGFKVEDVLSNAVTHVVAEANSAGELWPWLENSSPRVLPETEVLDISWFTESMAAGEPVHVEARHRLENSPLIEESPQPSAFGTISHYSCQRRTTMENHNKVFTDAFEILAENYEFSESEGPCLAFLRAASLLKSLPHTVRCLGDLQGLPCLGDQTKAVIEEILEYGRCCKVQHVLCDDRYQTMKLFTGVFGVGLKTAEKWYRKGFRSFEDVQTDDTIRYTKMQKAGFLYYNDIFAGVSKAEANAVGQIVEDIVRRLEPDAIVALTGGFRRGKEFGHDIDFLITTPETGKEKGLLNKVINELKNQGILLYYDIVESTFDNTRQPSRNFEAMDHFEKCFLMMKLKKSLVDGARQRDCVDCKDWKAIRVDFVLPPVDHFAFALLGWTGSRLFDRDLRRYARYERKMLLDNHALYDKTKKEFLPAKTEEDIFAHLGLDYIEPWQRNA
ncbi:DNA nucleotidylexotransferase [Amia ocellicauda]|uniref:DNA nucleotidylexotransferase n=1 Tax=Amia ocellicauda TaxID=2972642 RepID=UPI0034640CB8